MGLFDVLTASTATHAREAEKQHAAYIEKMKNYCPKQEKPMPKLSIEDRYRNNPELAVRDGIALLFALARIATNPPAAAKFDAFSKGAMQFANAFLKAAQETPIDE